jgi:polysaccharide pyruvyl transferase WcaK-like protein
MAGKRICNQGNPMSRRPPIRKVAAFAHAGNGNLGDEATMAVFLSNVRNRLPEAEILAITSNPTDTQQRYDVSAIPLRRRFLDHRCGERAGDEAADSQGPIFRLKQWVKRIPVLASVLRGLCRTGRLLGEGVAEMAFLLKASRSLKGTDLFVVVGGGQLTDYFGGSWGYPFTILKWCLLARMCLAKVVFLSTGAGPIHTLPGRLMLRWALSLANYRSFRNEGSQRLAESLGVSGANRVVPDLVFGVQPPATRANSRTGVVGINPLPYGDARYWPEVDDMAYRRHVETLASFAVEVIRAGRKVLLFPTQLWTDPLVIKDVEKAIRECLPALPEGALTCPPVSSFDDLFAAIARTDLVVGSRYHGIILSLAMSRPVIGLSYNQKTDDLMADMGLRDFVISIGRADVPWLVSRMKRLETTTEEFQRQIESSRLKCRFAVEAQYDRVLAKGAGIATTLTSSAINA